MPVPVPVPENSFVKICKFVPKQAFLFKNWARAAARARLKLVEDECYEGEMDEILQLILRLKEKLAPVDSLEGFSEPEKVALENDMDTLSAYVRTLNDMLKGPEPEEFDLCELRL